jgi:predicted transposase YbfD/YdcC
MGCQKNIAREIIEAGVDYVLALKGNHEIAHGEISEEERYYLCSIGLDVKVFAKAVRGHWGVENSCDWVLDVIFKEGESRARRGHAAQNLGMARELSMNLIRKESTHRRGIRGRVKRTG